MISVSLCMIVRNEEDVLARCLDSVKDLVDEIILVDTGSDDRTKQVARRYTDNMFDFAWIDDFAAARNFGFAQATRDYILWLDADDVMLEPDRLAFAQLKRELDPAIDVVMMRYVLTTDTQGKPTFSCFRERLVRRSRGFRWREPVHEYLEASGRRLTVDISITHRKAYSSSSRNLAIYERRLARGETLSPRGLYYYARELKDHRRYRDAIASFTQFLDLKAGWVEDKIAACKDLGLCHRWAGDHTSSLRALLRSMTFDAPRAELCCQIGLHYKLAGDYERALRWYGLAARLTPPAATWGFVDHDAYGYLPHFEMARCCYHLGRLKEARYHNAKAGEFKLGDPSVQYNEAYFTRVQADQKAARSSERYLP